MMKMQTILNKNGARIKAKKFIQIKTIKKLKIMSNEKDQNKGQSGSQGSLRNSNRGFASMDSDEQKELASKGGKASAEARQGESKSGSGNDKDDEGQESKGGSKEGSRDGS